MSIPAATAPLVRNPLRRIAFDLSVERAAARAGVRFPPGPKRFSIARTRAFERNPLPILLDAYERYGPIFAMRLLHGVVVFMLGPEANHYMTVSHADNFRWRDGSMGDLIPLIGDGLLTIDGAYHRRSRRTLLPAFHHDRIAAATATMVDETTAALDRWRPGTDVDIYHWTRALALRIAMRALLGLDPDRAGDVDLADEFERALSFWGRDYVLQVFRGPFTPWRDMHRHRRRLDRIVFAEVGRRRRCGERREDVLSLLLDATHDDGEPLTDREVRDHLITLMFAGHDTTTSTVTFLFHELARRGDVIASLRAEQAQAGARLLTAEELMSGLPRLEMAVEETLRMYPPAWVGPRRAVEEFSFAGRTVPARAMVNYCSWASHRLPEVFPEPDRFRPERFSREARARLPKGAYVPFGGGSRMCIGMRFGQLEVRTIATLVLERFDLEPLVRGPLRLRMMPTLSPRGGLPARVHARA